MNFYKNVKFYPYFTKGCKEFVGNDEARNNT